MDAIELCAHTSPPARGKRLPAAIRSLINRQAHAMALEFERQERERLMLHYRETGRLPADLLV